MQTNISTKPEVFQIANETGLDRFSVVGRLQAIWSWFDEHTETGNAKGVTLVTVDAIVSFVGFAQAMQNAGWLDEKLGVLILPNFGKHNGETAKARANTAKRVAAHRGSKPEKPQSNAPTVTPPLAREEKNREESVLPSSEHSQPEQAMEPKIDGIKLAQTLQEYCRASDKRYDSQAIDSMVRAIKSGATTQDELCATILEICTYAKRNPRAEKRFLPSPYDLIELEKWRSPLTSFLSTNVADFATQTATQAEMPYEEF